MVFSWAGGQNDEYMVDDVNDGFLDSVYLW